MGYAPITTIKLENFMSIAYAEIPIKSIISLCGYNDQGKSAVRTALEVVLYDEYSTEQVKYIKDGTDSFRITLKFADGVVISKEKQVTGTSIWRMERETNVNGLVQTQLLYTNAQTDGSCIATEDVPEVISAYLGVYYDENTRQELNVRKDRDAYFLVDSSGGDNYKMLNPLLHSDTLAKASELLLKDSNVCKSQIDETKVKVAMLTDLLDEKAVVSEDAINTLDRYIQCVGQQEQRKELLEQIQQAAQTVRAQVIPPEVTKCDAVRLNLLCQLTAAHTQCKQPVYNEVNPIDLGRYNLLKQMCAAKERIAEQCVYNSVLVIDVDRLKMIQDLQQRKDTLVAYQRALEDVQEKCTMVSNEVENTKQVLVAQGYKVCRNCGSLVE